MRTKALLMSTSLAASVWLTGCQSASPNKYADPGAGCAACSAKVIADSRESLHSDLSRLPGDKTEKVLRPATVSKKSPLKTNVAPTTNSGSAGNIVGPVAKAAPVAAASDTTCPAQTGSVVVRDPVVYTLPGTSTVAPANSAPPKTDAASLAPAPPSIPQTARQVVASPTEYLPPPTISAAPSTPAPVAPTASASVSNAVAPVKQPIVSSYGPGVEVISNPGSESLPAASAERIDTKRSDAIRIGQANNYQVVVGQVYQFRRVWKLRYTSVESDDKYGGSFTLVGNNLDHLKDGQIVRVEGSVLPSEDRTNGARYHVSRVEVIEPDIK